MKIHAQKGCQLNNEQYWVYFDVLHDKIPSFCTILHVFGECKEHMRHSGFKLGARYNLFDQPRREFPAFPSASSRKVNDQYRDPSLVVRTQLCRQYWSATTQSV